MIVYIYLLNWYYHIIKLSQINHNKYIFSHISRGCHTPYFGENNLLFNIFLFHNTTPDDMFFNICKQIIHEKNSLEII